MPFGAYAATLAAGSSVAARSANMASAGGGGKTVPLAYEEPIRSGTVDRSHAKLVPEECLRKSASIGKTLFHALGGLRVVHWRNRHGFRILMYHRFPTAHRVGFGRQLDYLQRHYAVKPLGEIVSVLRTGSYLEPHCLAITVDDGHRDFYDVAYPELNARSMSATVFLTTGFLDGNWLWFDRVIGYSATLRSKQLRLKCQAAHCVLISIPRRGGPVQAAKWPDHSCLWRIRTGIYEFVTLSSFSALPLRRWSRRSTRRCGGTTCARWLRTGSRLDRIP